MKGRKKSYGSKADATTEFLHFLMDCICIVLSYILASYLRFGNLWGGYTKGIVLLRMGILLMSITLVYFILIQTVTFQQNEEAGADRCIQKYTDHGCCDQYGSLFDAGCTEVFQIGIRIFLRD